MLEGFSGKKLMKEEADCVERWVREVTGWSDPVEEKIVFMDVVCENYDVLMDEKRPEKVGEAGPSGRYDSWSGPKRGEGGPADP